jgi:S-DNA-T family DNA segregation ATPase FtsK/SpoIIIE
MSKNNSQSSSTRKTKKTTARRRTSTTKKTSAPRKSSRSSSRSSAKSGGSAARRITLPKPPAISLDRKLDIIGIFLVLVGGLTILSLISTNRSVVTGTWISWLHTAFGWGTLVLPVAFVGFGLWLVLRHFERIPWPSPERVIGVFLLFIMTLGWLHLATQPETRSASFNSAAAGQGGGYLGAGLLELLLATVGWWGAAIVLAAGTLIGLALTLDRSVVDLFSWLRPIQNAFILAWQGLSRKFAAAIPGNQHTPGSTLPDNYTPLEVSGTSASPGSTVAASAAAGVAGSGVDFAITEAGTRVWVLPQVSEVLDAGLESIQDDEFDRQRAQVIESTLASFGAPGHVVEVNRGPTITQYGVEPDYLETRSGRMRVRVNKIASLADDLALALAARRIRIQAPVPGKGYIGIEVPNDQPNLVTLRDVAESEAFKRLKSPLRFALGQDVAGNAVAADLSAMPHLLIAGATGSGKSVCVNSIITCLLVHNSPDDLRLLMVDPKRVELTGYNYIPHLLAPVVVELERVVGALQWIAREMDQRYHRFAQSGARNIADYNARLEARGEKKIPYVVVIIDELADLMMIAPDETERNITRLAQLARATGIHLVIATQRPSVDVVTGLIKANFPARVAFAVASGTDSRVILDQPGAERLLGSGDMLFQAPDAPAPVRLQGVYVSDYEIQRVVSHWRAQAGVVTPTPTVTEGVVDSLPSGIPLKQIPLWEDIEAEENQDPLMDEAVGLVRTQGRASISMLQRRLRIGYTRAARLVEEMEARGIVGPPDGGTGVRDVLDYGEAAPPAEE